MEKFKLGLVGCGKMMGTHVKAVNDMDTIDIVAVCDIIPERAEDVAAELHNTPKIYTDYTKMVDDVDGVLIALPHDLHFECGMFFAYNKKHVLMEKPLCNSEEECVKLIKACDENGVTLMCAYPVRHWPGVVKIKEMIDSGKLGKVFQMSIWTEQRTGANCNFLEIENQGWFMTNRIGGGQLFSHGCHYVDILLWFLGNPVEGAHFGTNVGTPWMLREGTSSLIMKFENGAVAYHGATWGAKGTRMGYDFQIQTEGGMLEYDHHAGEVRLYNKEKIHIPGEIELESNEKYSVIWKREGNASKHTNYEIQHFVDCVRSGKEPITSGRKALQSLRVIWKVYDAEDHHTVADLRGLGLDNADVI